MLENAILIQVDGVSKTYHRGYETIAAVKGISLAIHKGELLAIVGPSGSGKTTLTHIIGGLITPDEGSVAIDGHILKRQGDKELSEYRNKKVGFVFQNFNLIPHYTAAENVAIPLIIAKLDFAERQRLTKLYLRLVGLEQQMNQRASELSGGERQRVSIARALVNQPQILITDEPTGSLDSIRGNEVMRVLETLSHKQGITVLMVTHDETLAKRADRIIHIKDGHIIKEQSHANR